MYCHAAKERSFIDCLRRYYVAALRSLNCVLALAKQREQCLLCDATYFLAKVAQVFILYKDLREQKLSSLRKVRKRASPHKSRGPAQIFFSFSVSLLLCSTVCKNPNKTWYLLRYRVFCRVFFYLVCNFFDVASSKVGSGAEPLIFAWESGNIVEILSKRANQFSSFSGFFRTAVLSTILQSNHLWLYSFIFSNKK